MTVFLPNSGRQNNNYMSQMSVLLLSGRVRIQTDALESGPKVEAAALGPSCSERGVSTVPF